MIDLDAMKQQIEEAIPWRDGVLTVAQARALISEVEILRQEARIRNNINDGLSAELRELRVEVADLRMQRDEHLIDTEHAHAEGRDTERAAVVAWLREGDKKCREWDERENAVSRTYRVAADAIERGEHRREEKE
jgi:hypothetical protein